MLPYANSRGRHAAVKDVALTNASADFAQQIALVIERQAESDNHQYSERLDQTIPVWEFHLFQIAIMIDWSDAGLS
jgi:hypothetical protein